MTERVIGIRMFARVRAFDIACPKCDQVHTVRAGAGRTRAWNPRLALFKCTGCGLTLLIGVVAWRISPGGARKIPTDWVPDLKQALELRELLGRIVNVKKRRFGRGSVTTNLQAETDLEGVRAGGGEEGEED